MDTAIVDPRAAFFAHNPVAALAGQRVAIIVETIKECRSRDAVCKLIGVVPLDTVDIPNAPIMVHPRFLVPMTEAAGEILDGMQTKPLGQSSNQTH